MRDVEELDTRATAERLEASEEAARGRLHDAREAPREWLYVRADELAAKAFHFAGERCQRVVRFVLARVA